MTPAEMRALDARVAEEVMGWTDVSWWSTHLVDGWPAAGVRWMHTVESDVRSMLGGEVTPARPVEILLPDTEGDMPWVGGKLPGRSYDGVPEFTTDIAAAFTVVEKMREDGWCFVDLTSYGDCTWRATFDTGSDSASASDVAPTLPLAICRAALRAKEEG